MRFSEADLAHGLKALGVTPQDLQPTTEEELKALQDKVKRAYKGLAVKLHPDQTSDPDKHRLFILLGKILDKVSKVKVQPTPNKAAVPVRQVAVPVKKAPTWQQVSKKVHTERSRGWFDPAKASRITKMRPK
jgi:hypothetical protein